MTKEELLAIIKKEGNELKFRYENYKCLIRRNQLGCWCGYIYIPKSKFYKAINSAFVMNKLQESFGCNNETEYFSNIIRCHGGITFFDETENGLYVIGFDCAHSYDISLYDVQFQISKCATYKDKKFVIKECKKIIHSIRKVIKNPPVYF